MPIDPDVQKALDGLTAALAPEALAKALAPIVKAHTDAAMKDVVKADTLAKFGDDLAAKLKPAEPDPKGKGGDKGKDDAPNEAMAALQKKVDETNARLEAAERGRKDAEMKAVVDRNRNAARKALADAGLDAKGVDDALAIVEARGELVLDGDKPGWKGKDKYDVDTVLDFTDGAKAFAATPSGKRFVPPSNASGTGDGNNNNKRPVSGTSSLRGSDGVLDMSKLGAVLPL